LNSGHQFELEQYDHVDLKWRLNPFEFRASVRTGNYSKLAASGYVSIPLNSGHQFEPTRSASYWWRLCLNPFEFRASVRTARTKNACEINSLRKELPSLAGVAGADCHVLGCAW